MLRWMQSVKRVLASHRAIRVRSQDSINAM